MPRRRPKHSAHYAASEWMRGTSGAINSRTSRTAVAVPQPAVSDLLQDKGQFHPEGVFDNLAFVHPHALIHRPCVGNVFQRRGRLRDPLLERVIKTPFRNPP